MFTFRICFFNSDIDEARVTDASGEFIKFDRDKLKSLAAMFLSNLRGLGVADLPTPPALADDFLRRT